MIKLELQFFGGRGASSGLPVSEPSGGGGPNGKGGLDAAPGMMDNAQDALGSQGRAMSVFRAVSGANPNYSMGREYRENCQRCVIATEARLRGYDVQALPTYDNDNMPVGTNYLTNFVGAKPLSIRHSTPSANRNDVEKQMANMGDGARATMSFSWSGARDGHVINVMQKNGKTKYYDGQNGTEVSASHLYNAISRSRDITLTRVDNLNFSDTVNAALRPTIKGRKSK